MELIGRRPFFDVTAGTGQFPYHLAKAGNRIVLVSDICPYAAHILRMWSEPEHCGLDRPRVDWLTDVARMLNPRTVPPREGFLTANVSGEFMSEEVATYLDGLAARSIDVLPLWLVGKAISKYMFRNLNFCLRDSQGVLNRAKSPQDLVPGLLRASMRARICAEQLKGGRVFAYNLDSLEAIRTVDFPVGTTVYMDTAWPFEKKQGSKNPYRVFVEVFSSAMLQKRLKATHLWERDIPEEQILADVERYITTAFDKGAAQFVVTTQDTNYPDPAVVFAYFAKRFNLKRLLKVKDYSSAAGRSYFNYWGFLTP